MFTFLYVRPQIKWCYYTIVSYIMISCIMYPHIKLVFVVLYNNKTRFQYNKNETWLNVMVSYLISRYWLDMLPTFFISLLPFSCSDSNITRPTIDWSELNRKKLCLTYPYLTNNPMIWREILLGLVYNIRLKFWFYLSNLLS